MLIAKHDFDPIVSAHRNAAAAGRMATWRSLHTWASDSHAAKSQRSKFGAAKAQLFSRQNLARHTIPALYLVFVSVRAPQRRWRGHKGGCIREDVGLLRLCAASGAEIFLVLWLPLIFGVFASGDMGPQIPLLRTRGKVLVGAS